MPLVTTIIARLLALQDWYLAQFVDVQVLDTSTSCYRAIQVNATVNACGQALLGNATGGWKYLMENVVNLAPNIISALVWTGPYGNWTPYVPPVP